MLKCMTSIMSFIQAMPESCTIHRENQKYICFQGTHYQVTQWDKSDKQIVR